MPVDPAFKTCVHGGDIWVNCRDCMDEVVTQLVIARTYLRELANGVFNDDGIMQHPISEPLRGRGFQSIAKTALMACSDVVREHHEGANTGVGLKLKQEN